MKEIVFVTSNQGKRKSAEAVLKNTTVICEDYGFIEPDVNDIEFIAKQKVLYAYDKCGKPCIALDAGFYIPAYPGCPDFPGAFPKRELIDKIGINGLIDNMKDIQDRRCYFKECLAYYDGTEIKLFYGISEGTLSEKVRGISSDKKWSDLWYVFIPKNNIKTLAEMTDEERINRGDNHISSLNEFSEYYNHIKVYT